MREAERAWNAYRAVINGHDVVGNPLPLWTYMSENLRASWCAVAGAALCTVDVEAVYRVYCVSRDNKDIDGNALKPFNALSLKRQDAWRAALRAVRNNAQGVF